jgi:predicted SnoaL-like aldol condensation-catalyzing enzyme
MKGIKMPKTTREQNKALVLEAFDTLFNKRDYVAAERFWSPHYIQHTKQATSSSKGSLMFSGQIRGHRIYVAESEARSLL